MAEEATKADGKTDGKPAGGTIGDAEKVKVNGVERVVGRDEILEGYSKYAAGQNKLDDFSREKQAWLEGNRETLNAAKLGHAFRKGLVEKDPAALKEALVSLGESADGADQAVKAWEAKMAGDTRKAAAGGGAQGGPNVESVLRQMADAIINIGKQNQEYAKRIELIEGTTKGLRALDLERAEAELVDSVAAAIAADPVQSRLSAESPDFLRQAKADAVRALRDRLNGGFVKAREDLPKAIKESLQEARAAQDNYFDGFEKAGGGVPIGGLPSRGAAKGLERYAPKKAPEPVSMTDPGYGQYLLDSLAADEARLIEEAKKD